MCDGVSLGRMLSEHIRSGAQDTHLLEEYNKKRQIVAKEVIKFATAQSGRMGAIAAMPDFVRPLFGGVLDHLGFMKKNSVMRMSGLVNRIYD
jgi:2-polyprenyl-6-methoxyphenol hydroxylase-like FAD-dependent oxidoreductase